MLVDPTTLAVVKGGLEQIATEMDRTLMRNAFSTSISEGYDYADGIYRPEDGGVIVQGPDSLPIFIGNMQFAVAAVLEMTGKQNFHKGDLFILNDIYAGGTHLMDVKLVRPYFYRGELFAFLANTGHWIDIGGSTPGGFGTKTTEIYQEGLIIPPVKLYSKGNLNSEVLSIILANVRMPTEAHGDLITQVNALEVGEKRLTELIERFGKETVKECIAEVEERSEMQMRTAIKSIPEGLYTFEDYMDSDGIQEKPIRIVLDLTVRNDQLHLDFSRSDPASKGPVNIPLGATKAACYAAIKHLFPEIPINAGCFKPISFSIPEGLLLNPKRPSPAAGFNELSQRVMDVVFGAMAKAMPEKAYAGAFSTSTNMVIGGVDPDRGPYVVYMFHGGGYGGSAISDGLIHGSPPASSAKTQPVEVYESRYPLRFHQFSIRENSAGAGQHRGGFGTIYRFELLKGEAVISILGDRGRIGPFGILGGKPGKTNEVRIYKKDGVYIPPHLTKDDKVPLNPGDIVELRTPGGGGYGDPIERKAEAVVNDYLHGYIDREVALEDYGVVITETGTADENETIRIRGESLRNRVLGRI